MLTLERPDLPSSWLRHRSARAQAVCQMEELIQAEGQQRHMDVSLSLSAVKTSSYG